MDTDTGVALITITPPEYILLPMDSEDEDDGTPERSPRVEFTPTQALQVGIWMLEGFTNYRIRQLLEDNNMPVPSAGKLQRMRHNEGLIEEARTYLRKEITVTGLAERAIRIRKLQRHADRLEKMIEETGLVEIGTKVIAFGKNVETLEERKFAALLSKEYRETIKQVREEVEPLERVVIGEQNNIFLNVSAEDKAQILDAMKWRPSELPQLLIEPEPQYIDAEVTVLEESVEAIHS